MRRHLSILGILLACSAASLSGEPAARANHGPYGWTVVENRVTNVMNTFINDHPFTGGVVIVMDHGSVWHLYYGSATADGRPWSEDTLFLVGSQTKTFTAALLAYMDGKWLNLSDPIAGSMPSCPGSAHPEVFCPKYPALTFEDLADYFSGLPKGFAPSWVTNEAALFQSISATHCVGCIAPKTSPIYSNWGYEVLGALERRLLGTSSWYDAVSWYVLTPLFLFNTRVQEAWLPADFDRLRAQDFDANGVPFDHSTPVDSLKDATGFLWSNLTDMTKYLQFMMGIDAYAPGSLTAILPTLRRPHRGPMMGLGWMFAPLIFRDGSTHQVMWKAGDAAGFHSMIEMPVHPDLTPNVSETAIFVLLNQTPTFADDQPTVMKGLGDDLMKQFAE